MGRDPRIIELLLRYEEALEQGQPVTPEELCQDTPELLDELRRGIADLQAVGPHLAQPDTGDEPSTVLSDVPARIDVPARAGRYQVEGEIAHGGMGAVWRARDTELNRDLAIKVLRLDARARPDLARRFVEEAQITGQLQHPGIPPVHEVGTLADGRPFFAMKLIRGRTLAALLRERTSPAAELPRFLGIFEQVCQAVGYAHSRGVIHRDLKPSNVMVGSFGEVQVMDWGLAKVLDGRPPPKTEGEAAGAIATVRTAASGLSSQEGAVLGTPAYMAPEQARGEVDRLDERCDVFGLGAMLCEILTGRPPYSGPSAAVLAMRAELGPARERLAGCGADGLLIALARRCLAVGPSERPRDAGEVADAVAAYQAAVQERLRKAELERAAAQVKVQEERKRRKLALGLFAAILAVVAVSTGAGVWFQQQRTELRREVSANVDKLPDLLAQWRWKEAETVLGAAESRLGAAGPDDLRARAVRARADLNLAARLDTARQRRTTLVEGKFDTRTTAREYARAFREGGLGDVGDAPEAVAQRVGASAVAGQLVAALDDWALVAEEADAKSWLLGVARRAAPDAWGDRYRDPAAWRDRQKLQALADEVLRDGGAKLSELSPQTLASLARLLRESGGDASPLLRAAQVRYPTDFWLSLDLGYALYTATQGERGQRVPSSYVSKAHGLGHAVRRAAPNEEALGYFRVAAALRPDASAAYTSLGAALYAKGDLRGAIAALRKAIELDPGDVNAHNNLGNALVENKDADGAITEFREAIERDPTSATAHYNLAATLRDEKDDLDGAIAEFRKARELDPGLAKRTGNEIGIALYHKGDLEGAITEFREAIDLDLQYANAHLNLGAALRAKRNLDGAIAEFRLAIAADPMLPHAHNDLGNALQDKRDLDGAIAAYRKAIELDPKFAGAHSNLGTVLAEKGDADGAIAAYRKAIELDPKLNAIHYNLGTALYTKGDLGGAVVALRRRIEGAPDHAEAHCNLGHALRDQGQFAEALEELRRGDELGRRRPGWEYPSAGWVRQCERLVTLDRELLAMLGAGGEPASPVERLEWAGLCQHPAKRLHAAGARLAAGAFAAEPRLAADVGAGHRYNAACSAAQAAAAQAEDAKHLPDKARLMLRRQALAWLRDDLAAYRTLAGRTEPTAGQFVRGRVQHWPEDSDLAAVRDPQALERLPDDERQQWRALWDDVAALLKKVEDSKK